MDITSGIVVFIMAWWIVFLMVLPFGAVAHDANTKGSNVPLTNDDFGANHGAPKQTHLKLKMLITTLITLLLWFTVEYLVSINFIDFRELGYQL